MRGLLLFILCLINLSAHAQIFKWIDSSGTVHYSDIPRPGAITIDIQGIEPTSSGSSSPVDNASKNPEQPEGLLEYREITISQPNNEATIRNNQGAVVISVELKPKLFDGDKFQLLLDGKKIGNPQVAQSFNLNQVDRGAHSVVVQVIKPDGNVAIGSDPVKFFMQRPRINMGNS